MNDKNKKRPAPPKEAQPVNEPAAPKRPAADIPAKGVLEVGEKGFGFLRNPAKSFQISPQDIYVSPDVIRRHRLRPGLEIVGKAAPPKKGSPQLVEIETINGEPPGKFQSVHRFDDLTVIQPAERFVLETVPDRMTTRVMDLVAPIGKGQIGRAHV